MTENKSVLSILQLAQENREDSMVRESTSKLLPGREIDNVLMLFGEISLWSEQAILQFPSKSPRLCQWAHKLNSLFALSPVNLALSCSGFS